MKKSTSIERKMLSYFGLIAAASLLITVEFMYAIHAATPDPEALAAEQSVDKLDMVASLTEQMYSLRNKAALMFVVQVSVTLIVLIMFMRRITGPLQHMVETSRVISEGDLSKTVRIRTRDEIGMLGETINGLTSNIQEIVAYGQTVELSIERPLGSLEERLRDDPESLAQLKEIEATLGGFKDLMDSFTLFPAPPAETEGDRLVAR
jgi:methyl-accepting chemotaxis protein